MPRIVFTPTPENPPVDFNTAVNTAGFYSIGPAEPPTLLPFGNRAFAIGLAPDGTLTGTYYTPGQPPNDTQFYLRRGSGVFTP